MWSEKLVTDAAVEPIDLDTARLHVRVDHTASDARLTSLITAARQWCENHTGVAFLPQQWDFYLQEWPRNPADRIYLPRATVRTVDQFEITLSDETTQTVSSTLYKVDTAGTPGCVALRYACIWPSVVLSTLNGIRVRYTCGSWDAPADVPETLKAAMLLLVGHWYEHPEAVTLGAMAVDSKELKLALIALLEQYRCSHFGV
jgi:uncharacterized phiE125 gp8 family phage protein